MRKVNGLVPELSQNTSRFLSEVSDCQSGSLTYSPTAVLKETNTANHIERYVSLCIFSKLDPLIWMRFVMFPKHS